jgi:16S rRNA A1518/A1519 N6-dimethyltransferase RsmA/KsgA/DIM1 with predicted DNA glycosylase/AP lyase activity
MLRPCRAARLLRRPRSTRLSSPLTNISRKNFADAAHEKKFFELVKVAFGGKRKMLRTTLGIDSSQRPEDVALDAVA